MAQTTTTTTIAATTTKTVEIQDASQDKSWFRPKKQPTAPSSDGKREQREGITIARF